MKSVKTISKFCLYPIIFLFIFSPLRAQTLPPVNLGLTSFVDGIPPGKEGIYLQEYLSHYSSYTFKDNSGKEISVFPDLDVTVLLNQLLYMHKKLPLINAHWGFNFIVPVVLFHSEAKSGPGDIIFGPFLQWAPIMGKKGPIFSHRIELPVIFPTGRYSSKKLFNAGSNIYSFNPYWSGTVFFTPRFTASLRFHYLWNFKNKSPNEFLFPTASSAQAGQAIHFNFASAYAVIPRRLSLGINSYFLKQFTDSKLNDQDIPNSKQQVFAVGPGGYYAFKPNQFLFFNLYFETLARNRPQGIQGLLRYVHYFDVYKNK